MTTDAPGSPGFAPDDPGAARAAREYAALARITDRHASTDAARHRPSSGGLVTPGEAVRLVAALAGGTLPPDDGEPPADEVDLLAALTLLPVVRAEVDELEAGLLAMGRGRGMTWAQLAHALGLRTAQAAQQRAERLANRVGDDVRAR